MTNIEVSTVIFDYGNNLVLEPFDDVTRSKAKDFEKELQSLDYRIKAKEIIKSWSKANRDVNYIHIAHFAQEVPIIEEALKGLGIRSSDVPKVSERFLNIYREGYKELCLNNPRREEVRSTIEHLKNKGKHLAVFSNGRSFDVNTAMKLYGIHEYFDFIMASEEIGVEKPDPLVFKTLINRSGETPSRILYVGDDPIRDVQASKKSGMKAVLYIPPKRYRKVVPWRKYEEADVKPDAVITRISQLKKLVI